MRSRILSFMPLTAAWNFRASDDSSSASMSPALLKKLRVMAAVSWMYSWAVQPPDLLNPDRILSNIAILVSSRPQKSSPL